MKDKFFFGIVLVMIAIFCFSSAVFAKNPAHTDSSTISVNSASAPADGYTYVIISVLVRDNQGSNLAGDKVTLTSTMDSGLTINDSSAGTNTYAMTADSNGIARFKVKSNNAGVDTFTAVDSSDSPPTPVGANEAKVTVTFTPSSVCRDTAPRSIPRLISAVSYRAGEVTLTWVKAADPVSRYILAYGTASKNYVHGNQNIGPQGTTAYVVEGLDLGKTYYFAVQAANGCTSGNLSNELLAVAAGNSALPTIPTPTIIVLPTTIPTRPIVFPTSPITAKPKTQVKNSLDELLTLPTQAPVPAASSQRVTKKNTSGIVLLAAIIAGILLIILESVAVSYWKKSKKKKDDNVPR